MPDRAPTDRDIGGCRPVFGGPSMNIRRVPPTPAFDDGGRESEGRSLARDAVIRDGSALRLHEAPGQGQAETARRLPSLRFVAFDSVEELEHAVARLRGDSGPVIG